MPTAEELAARPNNVRARMRLIVRLSGLCTPHRRLELLPLLAAHVGVKIGSLLEVCQRPERPANEQPVGTLVF